MPRLTIDARGKPIEVTDRYRIGGDAKTYEQMGRYYIDPSTRKVETIWERIISFIFSFDGFGIQTKDGYIIKCKDQ